MLLNEVIIINLLRQLYEKYVSLSSYAKLSTLLNRYTEVGLLFLFPTLTTS